jgi:predicted transcriptional regulator
LEFVWNKKNEGVTAREVHNYIFKEYKKRSLSKAAILIFLDELCKLDMLDFAKEPCRGGVRKRYYPTKSKEKTIEGFVENSIGDLTHKYPQETLISLLNILYERSIKDSNTSQEMLRKISSLDPSIQRTLESTFWSFNNPLYIEEQI